MYSFGAPSLPKGLRVIIIATVAVWIVELIPGIGYWVFSFGALKPSLAFAGCQIWRLATYLFLHDPNNPLHILFNMLALWMFGAELEELWGTRRFVGFYFIAGIGSGIFSVVQWNSTIIGASGAVLGLLTIYAVYFPSRTVLLFFIFPVPVRIAVAIIGLMSLVGARAGGADIAYLTHLGGIAVALLYAKYYSGFTRWKDRHAAPGKKESAVLQFRTRTGNEAKKNYYEEVIDPLLKKISEQGMESLTEDEKKRLEDASRKNKGPE